MNKKVYVLQGKMIFSCVDTNSYFIFSRKKLAEDFFNNMCYGCGIIYQAKCINNRKFHESMEVNAEDLHNL